MKRIRMKRIENPMLFSVTSFKERLTLYSLSFIQYTLGEAVKFAYCLLHNAECKFWLLSITCHILQKKLPPKREYFYRSMRGFTFFSFIDTTFYILLWHLRFLRWKTLTGILYALHNYPSPFANMPFDTDGSPSNLESFLFGGQL